MTSVHLAHDGYLKARKFMSRFSGLPNPQAPIDKTYPSTGIPHCEVDKTASQINLLLHLKCSWDELVVLAQGDSVWAGSLL